MVTTSTAPVPSCYVLPIGLELLDDREGEAFDVLLAADELAFAEGGVPGGALFEAAAFDEDLAGAEVFPGEIHSHDVELFLGDAGVDVRAEGAGVDVEDLALEDGVGVGARDDLVG